MSFLDDPSWVQALQGYERYRLGTSRISLRRDHQVELLFSSIQHIEGGSIGWQDFADSGTIKPIISDVAGGEALLTNDNNGEQTDGNTNINGDTTLLGVTDIWNSDDSSFDFAEAGLRAFDYLFIRFDFGITPNVVPARTSLELRFYDAAGGAGGAGALVFPLPVSLEDISTGSGEEKKYVRTMGFFIGESIAEGSMQAVVVSTAGCEIIVRGWNILTLRGRL